MTRGRLLVRPEWTTFPGGDVTAAEWGVTQGDIATLQLGQTRTNLRSAGLSLDGTTDETAALQTIIDNASDGEILVLDERAQLRVSSQILVSGKKVSIEGYGDAEIESTAILTVPIVKFENAPAGTHISNVSIKGAETTYVGAASNQYALEVRTSDSFRISDVRTSNTSRGGYVISSHNCTIENFAFEGLLTGFVTNNNWHSTILIESSNDTRIDGISGHNVGSTLLVGGDARNGIADRVVSHNAYDNGIYISGAEGWQISNPIVRNDAIPVLGEGQGGIKLRGLNHVLLGGYVENTLTGIAITDQNGKLDEDGAGGSGCKAIGTRVYRTLSIGASIEQEYGAPPRDAAILYCSFDNCNLAGNTSHASIRIRHGSGHQIIGNQITNQAAGRAGILVEGTSTAELTNITTALNKVRDVGANGIRYRYVNGGMIALNDFQNITGVAAVLIDVGSDSNQVTLNRGVATVGTSAGIRAEAGTGTNRIFNNPTLTVIDLGTGNVKYGNNNNNPAITGSRGGNAALTDLIAKLVAQGVITDSTSV